MLLRKALAHGLSQLSLRLEVLEEDALMAVQLYEETLSSKLGWFLGILKQMIIVT